MLWRRHGTTFSARTARAARTGTENPAARHGSARHGTEPGGTARHGLISFGSEMNIWYLARSGTWHDQVPGTIRYLARSGTWHDLVPGTTWQIWYLARPGRSGIWYPYIYPEIHIYIYIHIYISRDPKLQSLQNSTNYSVILSLKG
jgi:hypothetical protein